MEGLLQQRAVQVQPANMRKRPSPGYWGLFGFGILVQVLSDVTQAAGRSICSSGVSSLTQHMLVAGTF